MAKPVLPPLLLLLIGPGRTPNLDFWFTLTLSTKRVIGDDYVIISRQGLSPRLVNKSHPRF